MKQPMVWLAPIGTSLLLILVGCSDTAAGVSSDSQKMKAEVKDKASDLGAVVSLTPMIKAAFMANPFLNEPGNDIKVDSNAESVTLTGFVKSEKNKTLAEETVAKILKDKKSTIVVKNELLVKP